jgi:hypothetical protein
MIMIRIIRAAPIIAKSLGPGLKLGSLLFGVWGAI